MSGPGAVAALSPAPSYESGGYVALPPALPAAPVLPPGPTRRPVATVKTLTPPSQPQQARVPAAHELPLPPEEPPTVPKMRAVVSPPVGPPILTPPSPNLTPPRAAGNPRRTAIGTAPPPLPIPSPAPVSEGEHETTITEHTPTPHEPPVAVQSLPRLTGRPRIPPRPETEATGTSEVSDVSSVDDTTPPTPAQKVQTKAMTAPFERARKLPSSAKKLPSSTSMATQSERPKPKRNDDTFDEQLGDATVVDKPKPSTERVPLPRLSARLAARRNGS